MSQSSVVCEYLISKNTLDQKQAQVVQKISELLENAELRLSGFTHILTRLDNTIFIDILRQTKPQMYTKYLISDDPQSQAYSLFIISKLAADPKFVELFITEDETLFSSLITLLKYQNPTIFKRSLDIIASFTHKMTNTLDDLSDFVAPLVASISVFSSYRTDIVKLLKGIVQSPKTITEFLEADGITVISQILEISSLEETQSALEIATSILKTDLKRNRTILLKSGFIKPLSEVIEKTTDKTILELAIYVASQFAGCPYFVAIGGDSGLFEECVDMMEFPYTELSSEKTLQRVLTIIFRVTQDQLGVKNCSSLKLVSKLCNLLKNIICLDEVVQSLVFGITSNLLDSEVSQKEITMTKMSQFVVEIKEDQLSPKVQKLRKMCVSKLNVHTPHFDDKKQIDYTQSDIEMMASYTSKMTKAQQVVNELIQTEDSFVRQMDTCVNKTLKKVEKVILDKTQIVFGNISDIFKYHRKIVREMKSAHLKAEEYKEPFTPISSVLLKYFTPEMLDLYTKYTNNVDVGMALFTELSNESVEVQCLVKELSANDQYVPSYLIQPIQRIPRYVLLLETLLKCLPDYLEEKLLIESALKKIRQIASQVNESKRHHDNKLALAKWKGRLEFSDPKTQNENRSFVGEIDQVLLTTKKGFTLVTLIIFSDIAVLAENVGKGDKEKWKIKQVLELNEWKLTDIIKTDGKKKLPLFHTKQGITLELSCSKDSDVDTMEEKLQHAIHNLKKKCLRKSNQQQ
ncbi:Rho/RAC guanine nucleotide exchange factor, putative [Entamoeba invadens IP1]|uniref:Rho/RAC guanine nucleotide exchange factor, putative n=1 Tax=Entamoeba invadens IP1 TaxID=370355 RepID=A0A0A1U0P0_ENTIV|nr:Rho/RAC guanine nucleotide exchange factor, putative [Entamoeba invadens IP1]ELP86113.1 Rho/RAC guanine nucleotide exchange factor, putative [Entamoeba invadens IP1]|eukprot:XP_004185459.1 Rho/RAC guanine nucleotide exchange factor, putative [Entamoeba invadens IP1]